MNGHPDEKEDRKRQEHTEERVNAKVRIEFVDEIGPQHEETGVGQIHDLHDPIDDGHADRHYGVNTGQEQRGNQQIQQIGGIHDRRLFLVPADSFRPN